MVDSKDARKKKRRRFAAGAAGPGEQFVDWACGKGVLGVCLLAVVCLVAAAALFWFVVFSDFSASADFVYNQF